MKKLILLFLLSIVYGCYVIYEEPPYINLSGEYVIDRVVITNSNNSTLNSIVSLPGETLSSMDETFPMNLIKVGVTRWSFDYSMVRFDPPIHQYFYTIVNPMSVYGNGIIDVGYDIDFTHRLNRKFYIVNKNYQSLTLRTTGSWINGVGGPNQTVVLYLTRVGP
jgi:hypothetical protein